MQLAYRLFPKIMIYYRYKMRETSYYKKRGN